MEKEKNNRSGFTLAIIVFIAISLGLISMEISTNVKEVFRIEGYPEAIDRLTQPGVKPDSMQVPDTAWKEPEWIGR